MSDTPRTDEAVRASKGQWSFELRELCQNLERELEQVKAILDSLRALVTTDYESKETFIGRVNMTLNQPTPDEIDAHLDECIAKSALSWKPLPGDEP